jgi:isoleucyl-tRNA synthetase
VFRPVSPKIDLVELEANELARWRANSIFERSVENRREATPWIFYEGPPTANGKPGLHHVWARAYKDLFCRFQTMRGHLVERRAGWDTHGLPVEVEVEKRLGISGKRQIEEEVGIAEFTRLCKESVLGYVEDWRTLTERIGYWTDLDQAYWTFAPDYVESVWWQLKVIFDKGLLYEDLKVVPYCPRCGTALSSHELGQPGVYEDELDESAYVAFELVDPDDSELGGARHLVVWTTTPWTLLSNTGVAVNPELIYAVVDGKVVAEDLVGSVFGEGAEISQRFSGSALVGVRYRRPFDDVALEPGARAEVVVAADYVTTEEGTGLVHLAPAFGEIDRLVGRRNDLATLNPVAADGSFTEQVPWLAGKAVRSTNTEINDALEARGALLRRHPYVHPLPHCWRCKTVLIYWGKPSWYIATSKLAPRMMEENQQINWQPEHIRDGRFGEWLANNVDWALSRDRFWGTPLPIWRCAEGHLTCVASRAELSELAGRDLHDLDPHRPAIDEVVFDCPVCTEGGSPEPARRVEPVIDAWFDSGSMPAAQVGYPHRSGSAEAFAFPADFITEAIDQTRGWFYSLLAVNTLVFDQSPYRNVMCLGHIVDAEGRKMSKSQGNIIDPYEILDSIGADGLRWWMYSQGSPWTPTRVSIPSIQAAAGDMLGTLWNTYSFFSTYASLNHFDPQEAAIPQAGNRGDLDRWILSRAQGTLALVTEELEGYEPLTAATAIGTLVDDLSNWYVRRSRRRFWRTDPSAPPEDSLAAQATLLEVLVLLAEMLAPLTPFFADVLWRGLTGVGEDESVHLASWPVVDRSMIDPELEASMEVARRLTSLGRAARADAGVKVRQPLARALVFLPPGSPRPPAGVVEDELNVDLLEEAGELSEVLRFELVPNFKAVGPRLGESVKHLKPALAKLDGVQAAKVLESGQALRVALPDGEIELSSDDVELRVRSQEGFAVSREGGEVVALDLALDDGLLRRGLLRELIRQIQELRKSSGFELADRVRLELVGLDELDEEDLAAVGTEVLAVEVVRRAGEGEGHALELEDHPEAKVWLTRPQRS